jgi:hypothetical protein
MFDEARWPEKYKQCERPCGGLRARPHVHGVIQYIPWHSRTQWLVKTPADVLARGVMQTSMVVAASAGRTLAFITCRPEVSHLLHRTEKDKRIGASSRCSQLATSC